MTIVQLIAWAARMELVEFNEEISRAEMNKLLDDKNNHCVLFTVSGDICTADFLYRAEDGTVHHGKVYANLVEGEE